MSARPDRVDLAPPPEVVRAARATLGAIDLDPYSTALINGLVLAGRIYDRDQEDFDAVLARPWDSRGDGRVFIGPPTGAGVSRRLLHKLLAEYRSGRVRQAVVWLGHNETLIRTPWLWDFPMCLPFRRLRPCYFDDELEEWRSVAPSDWSAIVYLPPASPPEAFHTGFSRFAVAFGALGRVVFDSGSGDDDWQRHYQVLTGRAYDFRS